MTLQFEPIHLDRQDDYARHFSKCPQKASDYSFVNLWGWAEEYGLRWAWQDRLVWIKQTRPEALYWAPVGPWNAIDWARLAEAAHRAGLKTVILPKRNARDLEDVPQEIRNAMLFILVDRIDEAIDAGLTPLKTNTDANVYQHVDQDPSALNEKVLAMRMPTNRKLDLG